MKRGIDMLTLFIRTLILYLAMFVVMRLMGKRQLSDMQPFDLAVTLLIANLASEPVSDPSIPLLYGIIPIIALFILQRIVSFSSLKSEGIRRLICGNPLVIISNGMVREDVMRAANYTLNDLSEQLRIKDIFSFSQVEYAILETNGSLSVLPKGPFQQPTNEMLKLESDYARPALLLITDGKVHSDAVSAAGLDENGLMNILRGMGYNSFKQCLFASLDSTGMLQVQDKQRSSKKVNTHYYKLEGYVGK